MHFCPPIVGNIRVPDGCGGRNSSFFTRHRLWYSPFKPFSPEGGNICVPAGCGGRNSAFFTRHRSWYGPFKPFPPEGGNICVPAGCGGRYSAFLTRRRPWYGPPSSHFPRKAEIFVCPPGVADEISPFSPGTAILHSGTHCSEVQSLPSRLFSSQAGIGNAMILS